MHERELTRINIPDLIRLVTSITRAAWNQRLRAVLTDQEMFIAMPLRINLVVNKAAR